MSFAPRQSATAISTSTPMVATTAKAAVFDSRLWNHPGDDLYGMFSRNRRIVDRVEELLTDEPYHYHSKMIMKEARTGGAWAWHQDYGYWYDNGVLFPNLCSVFVAVDPATRANGCLQVLRGSHHMGRIEHLKTGDQTGADPERVAAAAERLELVHVEMSPGDALFFHANLLHRSDQNRSENDRWALVCCYNARGNSPYKDGQTSRLHATHSRRKRRNSPSFSRQLAAIIRGLIGARSSFRHSCKNPYRTCGTGFASYRCNPFTNANPAAAAFDQV